MSHIVAGKRIHEYCFNGLSIRSEIPFSEVRENIIGSLAGDTRQITIKYGKVPETLTGVTYSNPVISISATEALIHIEGTAWYYIDGENNVTIEAYPEVPEYAVRLYIFSIVLGILLHKNDIFSLHSSCIKVNDGAVIIAGQSGVGKSTLALGLYRKGYEILNDDISSVFLNEDKGPMVYPGVQHLKLWSQSLEKYEYNPGSFAKLRDELEKYSFPVERNNEHPLPLKAIYFLHERNETPIEKVELRTGMEKIKRLRNHTYRYKLIQHLQKTETHFRLATGIVPHVPFYDVYRSAAVPPAAFVDYMEEQFSAL